MEFNPDLSASFTRSGSSEPGFRKNSRGVFCGDFHKQFPFYIRRRINEDVIDGTGNVAKRVATFQPFHIFSNRMDRTKGPLSLRIWPNILVPIFGAVSRSPLMQRVFEVLSAIAASPSKILVLGETGTGKEPVARTFHHLSARHEGPFMAVNCSPLPHTFLESELFSSKAGTFTGAEKDKSGRFMLAKEGTIFLNEIGELNPAFQVKLFRVL